MYRLFDDMPELVYVVDMDTYEVLYINKAGKKAFSIGDQLPRGKCYEVFQGASVPCSFCTNQFLSKDEVYTWERKNPLNGRTYILRDSLIEWNGKTARIEIAMDITKQVDEKKALQHALDAEKMLLHCVRQLNQETDVNQGIEGMLRQVGEELNAERTYMFTIQGDRASMSHEWCAPGVPGLEETGDQTAVVQPEWWMQYFDRDECLILEDLESIRESEPKEYERLKRRGIHSLVAAPLKRNESLIGYLGVENVPIEKMQYMESLFNTLRYFLTTAIRRMTDEAALQRLSYYDSLTGLFNRNRYLMDLDLMKESPITTMGVLFMDLNGLKEINDKGGHAQGDKALIKCAEMLRRSFPDANLYRIGGDEFVAIECRKSNLEFYAGVSRLWKNFREDCEYRVAVGSEWTNNSRTVESLVQQADTDMYNDKRRYYRNGGNSRRDYQETENEKFSQNNPLLKEYNLLMSSLHISVSKHLMRDDFEVIWANDYFYKLTGYPKEEFEETFHNSVLYYFKIDMAEYHRLCNIIMHAFRDGKAGYETILHLPQKGGTNIWIRLVGTFTEEHINGVPVIYTVFSDVTDLIRTRREQVLTYDSLPGFVARVQVSEGGLSLLYGNQRFRDFFGQQEKDKPGRLLLACLRENAGVIQENYGRLRHGENVTFPLITQNTQGMKCYFQIYANCIDHIQGDPVYLVIFIDITQLRVQQTLFQEIAFVDSVTKGRNRSCFENETSKALLTAKPFQYSLVSIDIQRFKVINDLFGIEAGDKVLHYVYHAIQESLVRDEFVARMYSDTFNLFLRWDNRESMRQRLEELAESINSFNHNLTRKYILVLAAGIYPIEDPNLPVTTIQDRANVARKKTKGAGVKNLCICKFYSNQERLIMQREKEIENQMRDALLKDQFVVYLQPKMNQDGTMVAGAEALVRWQDPEHGLIPPDSFIPLFEKNGFVIELDLYVFEMVCRRIRSWMDRGWVPVPVSVNLSKAHLSEENFFERYESVRKKYQVPASLLEIEITETLVFENPQLLSSVIDQIHGYGYQCSMDDFGSGNSSLNVLKDIRVDILKLDRAFFTSDCLDNPWETAIISLVVELAKRLKIKTVAEGVETVIQAEFLKNAGCDMMQGFLFSRPLPAEEFEAIAFGKKQDRV